ncbi:uncharacterized protein N7506_000171 [Penicillium brevicompactum]|uniref:uncharacterized protein n=1 Tax=Penicillium brevicompactum TaxID=5074 RepID=UPI00253FA039|nr:uncharacterized protein N7506_000171 [Penicillium brevicompactum]KAJ5346918.1 hypothetical protein N7506_000171 [Penicillium brevicompactum]
MLTLNIAYTELVNSSDPLIPILSRGQVWNGLKSKARRPQNFIPSFDDSRVIEERDDGSYIVRALHVAADLSESPMAGKWTREECKLHEPVKDLIKLCISRLRRKRQKGAWDDHMKIAISSVQGTIKALRTMAEVKKV